MTLTFMMTRSGRSDYIVINMADTSATDVTEMARTFCLPPRGIGVDGLAVVEHLDRTRFAIQYLSPDGTESPAEGNVLRCCARTIEIRYGYRSAILVASGSNYESRIAEMDIGLRLLALCDTAGPCNPPLPTVYRNWPVSDNIVTSLGDVRDVDLAANGPSMRSHARLWPYGASISPVEAHSIVGASATALRARRSGIGDNDNDQVEAHSGSVLYAQAGMDTARDTWLYGPAMLLFEAEFPWFDR